MADDLPRCQRAGRGSSRGPCYFSADLLLLGATITTQLSQVAETIAAIRAGDERGVKIVVGGALFDGNDGLWKKVGADGYAGRVDEAVALGSKLVGG